MNPFSLDHIFPLLPQYSVEFSSPRRRTQACFVAISRVPSFRCQWTDSYAFNSLHAALRAYIGPAPKAASPSLELSKNTIVDLHEKTAAHSRGIRLLEVWGLEPQTYGLQSHRSSH